MLQLILVIAGTVIGGGFISGREIGTYFLNFGRYGIMGMICFGMIFFLLCAKINKICTENKINNEKMFFIKVFGKRIGKTAEYLTAAFSFIIFCAMISALSGFINEYIHINKTLCRIILSAICFRAVENGFEGVKKFSEVLTPFLLAAIFVCGIYFGKDGTVINMEGDALGAAFSAVIYTCYNMITVIPAVVISSGTNEKSNITYFLTACILVLCAVLVGAIIDKNYVCNMRYTIPVIHAVNKSGVFVRLMVYISIISALTTTAVSVLCWAKNCVLADKNKIYVIIMFMFSVILSTVDFSVFVDKMYFLFGFAALWEMAMIFKYN